MAPRLRLAALLSILAALLFGTVSLADSAPVRTIYVRNLDASLSDAKILSAWPALQAAVDEDFAPEWGAPARLVYIGKAEPPPGGWLIELTDFPACFFCAGYHDVEHGVPYAEVGVFDGEWTVTFTHELWELLADPYIDRGMLVSPKPGVHRWYALETADPVEGDQFAYTRPGRDGEPVKISDFITEAWFRRGSSGPFDFTRSCTRPLQLLKDGYQLLWRDGAWTSIDNFEGP